jgi:hypothetical protein
MKSKGGRKVEGALHCALESEREKRGRKQLTRGKQGLSSREVTGARSSARGVAVDEG